MNWFYSKAIKQYVSLQPVGMSAYVSEAAKNAGISPDWDDCGNIINLTFDEARRLAGCLHGRIMTPWEYRVVYEEAVEEGRQDVVESLSAENFSEFLNRVYVAEGQYIDDPFVKPDFDYVGTVVKESTKELSSTEPGKCIAVRNCGHAGTTQPEFAGISVDSRLPKLMLRICLKEMPSNTKDASDRVEIEKLLLENDFDKLEEFRYSEGFKKLKHSSEWGVCDVAERLYFALGKIRLDRKHECSHIFTIDEINDYIFTLRGMLKEAILEEKQIVFVTGHRNPDTDAVIASIFEAYRLTFENSDDDRIFVPLIQSDIMPGEVAWLLGEEIYPELIYETDIDMEKLLASGRVRVVLTDQNYQADLQKYVIGITDHHALNSSFVPRKGVPCIVGTLGSCTALVATKYLGQGYCFDKQVARLFYGAMLMDTENRVEDKMTAYDHRVMDLFKSKADITDDDGFYSEMMEELLSETDMGTLYYRDYKTYDGFAFSTIKVCDFLDKECFSRKIKKFKDMASENNSRYDYFFTVIKLVEYEKSGLNVLKERIYFVFNDSADEVMRSSVKELVESNAKSFPGEAKVTWEDGYLEITKAGRQVSRKWLASAIEDFVKIHNK